MARHNRWGRARRNEALQDYLDFMTWVKERGQAVALPADADEVWHRHILHSGAYRQFCDDTVGRFVDHDPGAELTDEQLEEEAEAWEKRFGRRPRNMSGACLGG